VNSQLSHGKSLRQDFQVSSSRGERCDDTNLALGGKNVKTVKLQKQTVMETYQIEGNCKSRLDLTMGEESDQFH
jgi:hypothetical protein